MAKLFFLLLFIPGILAAAPSNLILITIDTLRADHLGCYGNKTAKTPNLDALARKSLFFENAVCSAPITLPSHTSLMTGRHPYRHGIRDNAGSVSGSEQTLAEILKRYGYHTYAFVGGFPLDHRFGLNQGFDLYDDRFPRQKNRSLDFRSERDAESVANAVLQARLKEPYFLWVHFYDPHTPYLHGGYDGEIAFTDRHLGRLLQRLDIANSFLAVAGDHGESLGEHSEWTHRIFVYDSSMRVPFFILGPGIKHEKVVAQVQLVDFLPTILTRLKIPIPQSIDGRPLPQNTGRTAILESFFPHLQLGWSPLLAVRTNDWKYIDAPKAELYNLKTDPGEKENVIRQNSAVAAKLRAGIPKEKPSASGSGISPEMSERLAALGYVSGSFGGAPSRIDPKDQIHVWNQIERAVDLEQTKPGDAVEVLEQARKRDPDNPMILGFLAQKYAEAHQFAEAKKVLQSVLQRDPKNTLALYRMAFIFLQSGQPLEGRKWADNLVKQDSKNADAWILLARANLEIGQNAAAIQSLKTALTIDPQDSDLRIDLGNLLAQNQQIAEARMEFQQSLQEDPNSLQALNGLATCAFEEEQFSESETLLKKALAIGPEDPQTRMNLALLYSSQGRKAEAIALYHAVANSPKTPPDWKKQATARLKALQN